MGASFVEVSFVAGPEGGPCVRAEVVCGDREAGQGYVVLARVDVAVAEAALGDRAGEGDLHDVEGGDAEDLDLAGVDLVEPRDDVLVQEGLVGGDGVAGGVLHEGLQGDPEGAGVLGADLDRVVGPRRGADAGAQSHVERLPDRDALPGVNTAP